MTIADSDGDILHFYHLVPIGSVVAWLKDFTNTPALPEGWVECDGAEITDADSPFNGQNAPDLNNTVGNGNKGRFLRGHSESCLTEDSQNLAHTHTIDQGSDAGTGAYWNREHSSVGAATNSTGDTEARPFNYSVVWIFRIK